MRSGIRLARPHRGWTLVELAIVLAVAGLLAGIAWPSYSDAVRRARRTDATEAMARVLLAQEHWRARHGGYASTLEALGLEARSGKGHYRLALSDAGHHGFTLHAEIDGAQGKAADADCAAMSMTVLRGQATQAPAACWSP